MLEGLPVVQFPRIKDGPRSRTSGITKWTLGNGVSSRPLGNGVSSRPLGRGVSSRPLGRGVSSALGENFKLVQTVLAEEFSCLSVFLS